MQALTSTSNLTPTYIGKEEIEAILEIRDLCFFHDEDELNQFWDQVLTTCHADTIYSIPENDFETAYLMARSILYKRGEQVFKSHRR
jgi:hypothetical protein